MSILEGQFAMILIASCKNIKIAEAIKSQLHKECRALNLSMNWRDIPGKLKRGEKHLAGTSAYLISGIGRDRTGIINRISQFLYKLGGNVTDLRSRILGEKKRVLYSVLMECDLPVRLSQVRLKNSLARLSKTLGIEISAKPIEALAC